jgi:hypothetical protein
MQASSNNQPQLKEEELNIFRARLLYQMIMDKARWDNSRVYINLDNDENIFTPDKNYTEDEGDRDCNIDEGSSSQDDPDEHGRDSFIPEESDSKSSDNSSKQIYYQKLLAAAEKFDGTTDKTRCEAFLKACWATTSETKEEHIYSVCERELWETLNTINKNKGSNYEMLDKLLMDYAFQELLKTNTPLGSVYSEVEHKTYIHPDSLNKSTENADFFALLGYIKDMFQYSESKDRDVDLFYCSSQYIKMIAGDFPQVFIKMFGSPEKVLNAVNIFRYIEYLSSNVKDNISENLLTHMSELRRTLLKYVSSRDYASKIFSKPEDILMVLTALKASDKLMPKEITKLNTDAIVVDNKHFLENLQRSILANQDLMKKIAEWPQRELLFELLPDIKKPCQAIGLSAPQTMPQEGNASFFARLTPDDIRDAGKSDKEEKKHGPGKK